MSSATVAVSVADSPEQLRSLAFWMSAEDEFHGCVSLREQPDWDGEPSGVPDAVVVVLCGDTASAFVTSLLTWLSRHHALDRVTLTMRGPSGREIELECGAADDATELVEVLRPLLDDET
ncbi:hypothetical protein [Prauserella sp. PE36]|uniref:effector-associated constant component EACC1 n=1 Tax=Prauserella sp. PE36 TaxID=1504709 RepID=UPI002105A122|nr:hypothetical protein [Prauserella sp. PE36]